MRNTDVDPGCAETGECLVKRAGLCALPPARIARSHLPAGNVNPCTPRSAANSKLWPYPDYYWNQKGTPGNTSQQVGLACPSLNSIYLPLLTIRNTGNDSQACPKGLDGTARWYCLPSGGWDGSVPDLSDCTKIDTDTSKSQLKKNDSVPVEVRFSVDLHHHATFCNRIMT